MGNIFLNNSGWHPAIPAMHYIIPLAWFWLVYSITKFLNYADRKSYRINRSLRKWD